MLLKILQMLLFFNYGVENIFSFSFIEAFFFGFNDFFDSKRKNVSQHTRITSLVGK